jgi:hypothetical protein
VPSLRARTHRKPRLPCACPPRSFTATLLLLASAPAPVLAQVEYRNLDEGRPVVTEDAYPIERFALELVLPYSFEAEASGAELHLLVPELAYGVARNTQVGVKLPLAARVETTGTESGLAGAHVFALHNFNTESPKLPAVSLRGDLSVPVGGMAGEDVRVGLEAIATRSWGRTRAHVNAAAGFGSEDALSNAEPIPRWGASLAVDRTFFRSSLLLVGELATAQQVDGAQTSVNAAIGIRWQWTPTLVLDAGVARRLRSDIGPNIGLTVGISHGFALAGLMPGVQP